MSFFNKKRTDSTYLKYKNGRIHSLGKDEQFVSNNDNDNDIGNENLKYKEDTNNKRFSKEPDKKKDKNPKSKILIITGLCIMLIPFTILGFKYFNKSVSNITDFMGEDNSDINKVRNINEVKKESSNKTEIAIKNNDNKEDKTETSKNISLNSILSKINPETSVSYSNKVNVSMTNYYSIIKSDLILFYDSKESSYTTGKNLEAVRLLINKDYQAILSKEPIFEKENEKDLYIVTKNRYINILNTVEAITSNVSRVNCAPTFNSGLDYDNKLCEKQQELITSYLKSKNVNFETSNNIINIK